MGLVKFLFILFHFLGIAIINVCKGQSMDTHYFNKQMFRNTLNHAEARLKQSGIYGQTDTLLFEFPVFFGELNFHNRALTDEQIIDSLRIRINDSKSFYDYHCFAFDEDFNVIAIFGEGDNYYVFEAKNYNREFNDYLSSHIKAKNIVFRPSSSKINLFNMKYRMVVNDIQEIKWFDINFPEILYSTQEILSDTSLHFLWIEKR